MGERRRAAFLDRDGTVVEEANYLTRPGLLRLEPGAAAALRRLKDAGYMLILVTNQSAVARGMMTEAELAKVHERLAAMLAEERVSLDGVYYCPHLPDGEAPEYAQECGCRKPAPGMLLRAARERGVDLAASIMIGDSERDVEAGRRAGCRTALLHHGRPRVRTAADLVAVDLAEAVEAILDAEKRKSEGE